MNLNLGMIVTAGLATLAAGVVLQGAYKATNYYPPPPVFWFAIGASGSVLLSVAGNLTGRSRALTF